MSRPTLQHLQVADLIANAGGDPWAVDDSLQAGSPTQINFLAQAFHQAAGSATAAEQTFQTAQQHFQQYNRENGEQPINNGAEVTRVKDGLHATNQQLGQIAADLETIAAALAQARTTSQENITTLNGNLEGLDTLIDTYLQQESQGHNHDTDIQQCQQLAKDDTATALHNVSVTRNTYSKTLQQALTNLRVKDGYDPDVEVRKFDAENEPAGRADGGAGAAGTTNGAPTGGGTDGGAGSAGQTNGTPTDGGAGGNGNPNTGTAPSTDGGAGGVGTAPGAPDGKNGDGGGAALPPWVVPPGTPVMTRPGAPPAPPTQPTKIGGNWGNVGDGLAGAGGQGNVPWVRPDLPAFVPGGSPSASIPGGIPTAQAMESVEKFGKRLGYAGMGFTAVNGYLEYDNAVSNGVSRSTAAVDVIPKTAGDLAGGWVGAGMGAETGAEVGATIGTFLGPGPGTAIGAVLGAGVGAAVGGWAGSEFGKDVGEGISNVSHSVWRNLFG